MSAVLLGADVGTSGLKLVALDQAGRVVAEGEAGYDLDRPQPGWAETHPVVWRRALDDALAQVTPALAGRRVAGLGLSGQMHGTVLVDAAGAALAPAVLWPDARADAEVARWRALPDADRAALANPLVAGMTGPVLAWLAAHRPELVARAAAVLLPKDALRAGLVGAAAPPVTDRSDASATLVWDVVADGWSAAACAAAGIDPALLPEVRPSAEVAGTTGVAWAGEVPVVVGGADTPLALLASGTRDARQVNLGSGVQVLAPGRRPAPADDPPVHCYADVEDGWYGMAALQNGGLAWSWVAGVLGMPPAELFAAAASVPPGAGGVVFRPFLTGERGGVAEPSARGGWTGLSAGTTRADLARAAVEGVLFAVGAAAELLGGGGPVVLTGGGGRSPVVRQLLADVLGVPVRALPLRSASAVGAARLAGRGTGVPVDPPREPGQAVEPRPAPALEEARRRWRAA
ncbi:xylulokinase [Geodermatophilus sp. CPCC 206100]|uniref:xylulokinase n=1 Tax=Geodermatophilus sp. CPCC 206100 TaxID=3020054 RepID=UPI003B003F21